MLNSVAAAGLNCHSQSTYAVICVLLLASAILYMSHPCNNCCTCAIQCTYVQEIEVALKELHQQLMNQALVNQRKEPQNQNIHDSKLTCG